jgi:hypothetical protein
MFVTASITGLFKTILIILGAFVLLRFLGQVMMAKRNMEEERRLNRNKRNFEDERAQKLKNFGKVTISGLSGKGRRQQDDAEDAEYEEIN